MNQDALNVAIQDLFNQHKASGTMAALVAALLDVQAIVIATVGHDGNCAVEYAVDKSASSATATAVMDLVATAAVSLKGA